MIKDAIANIPEAAAPDTFQAVSALEFHPFKKEFGVVDANVLYHSPRDSKFVRHIAMLIRPPAVTKRSDSATML
jgi:hypothetical protein